MIYTPLHVTAKINITTKKKYYFKKEIMTFSFCYEMTCTLN